MVFGFFRNKASRPDSLTDGTESDVCRPRRILHIGKYFPPHRGGMETYLRDLMNIQRRAGTEVCALVHSSSRRLTDQVDTVDALDGSNYEVVRSAHWFTLGFVPISPLFMWSAWRTIKRFKPDVIHLHLPNASPVWMLLLPTARKIPWIASWHSDVLTPIASRTMRLLYKVYRPLERLQLKQCHTVYASSPPYAEHSPALADFLDKVQVKPLELDPLRLPNPQTVEPLPKSRSVILTVGRMAIYKGIPDLIRACSVIPEADLWLVGSGEVEQEAKRLVEQLGMNERVTFWGDVNDALLWRIYKTCDVFCLASTDKTEAFGMVLLEAANFGKLLVVRDIEGSGVPWVAKELIAGVGTDETPGEIRKIERRLVKELE